MKIKKGFLLRKVGNTHIVVGVGEAGKALNGMLRLNETGAFLWNEMKEQTTEDELVEKLTAMYPDVERNMAKADIDEFLASIAVALESEE